MPLINPASPGTGQLAQVGYAAEGWQVGLGNSYGQAIPADVYTGVLTGTSITPLTSTLVVTTAGTISALTIVLPSGAVEGQRFRLFCNHIISTITWTGGTNAAGTADVVTNMQSAGAANVAQEYVYRLGPANNTGTTNLYTWYQVQ
jgi:hypothetical protein